MDSAAPIGLDEPDDIPRRVTTFAVELSPLKVFRSRRRRRHHRARFLRSFLARNCRCRRVLTAHRNPSDCAWTWEGAARALADVLSELLTRLICGCDVQPFLAAEAWGPPRAV